MAVIHHPSHQRHALRFAYGEKYVCDGCQEYECRTCNFTLHESCALAAKSIRHSCHPQHSLLLRNTLPALSQCLCDVCGEQALGFVYSCRGCDVDVHPSCAKLPPTPRHALHPHHTLQLLLSNTRARICNVCGACCIPGLLSYRCCQGTTSPCDFNLDISCAKLPVDPLEEMRMQSISPLDVPPDPNSYVPSSSTVVVTTTDVQCVLAQTTELEEQLGFMTLQSTSEEYEVHGTAFAYTTRRY